MLSVATKVTVTRSDKKSYGIYYQLLDVVVIFHDGKREVIECFSKICDEQKWLMGEEIDICQEDLEIIQNLYRVKQQVIIDQSGFDNLSERLNRLVIE
jgi:hypothetical protein